MAKKKRRAKSPPSRKRPRKKRFETPEIIGILLLLLAVLILLSLISYHGHDPSWASVSSAKTRIHNYAGRVGASLAEALLQLFGFAAFILPFGLLFLSIQTFRAVEDRRLLSKTGGIVFTALLVSALLFLLFGNLTWREAEIPAGGLAGSLIASFLVRYFNHTGSLIVLLALLLLFLVLTTQVSIRSVSRLFARLSSLLFKAVRLRITRFKKEKQRKKMQERVIKKYQEPKLEKTAKPDKKERKKPKKLPEAAKAPVMPPAAKAREEYLFPEMGRKGDYQFPPLTLLDPAKPVEKIDKDELYEKKLTIEEKLREFQIEGEVKEYHPGPIITTYEFYPQPGIRVSQVANLSEDLSLALRAESVRIQRIPGKSSLGIEAPNNHRETIKVRDVIGSEKFVNSPSKLTFALGKTVHGDVYVTDLTVMPHLLIAGATGTGKSVALNVLITSILYKATPDEVKLILIDPKRLEFTAFDGVPHLMTPVVRDPKKAEGILLAAIREMEHRYHKLGLLGVRNIEQFNQQIGRILKEKLGHLSEKDKEELKPLPYIVIIIDELAELMMIGAQEVEYCIARLAQLARAVGIHLVLATQRPSIDVITGTIKNNFSSRIAFRVPSKVDSRIIIDTVGADQLLGQGDMLFMPPNYPRIIRLHCSFISLPEVNRLIKFVKGQAKPSYDEEISKVLKSPSGHIEPDPGEKDPLFDKAVELVLLTGQASASYLQRKLKLGYARAARVLDQMEQEGIVGPSEGSKAREILVSPEAYLKRPDGEE